MRCRNTTKVKEEKTKRRNGRLGDDGNVPENMRIENQERVKKEVVEQYLGSMKRG